MNKGGTKRWPGMEFAVRFTNGETFTVPAAAHEFDVTTRSVYRWLAFLEAFYPIEWVQTPEGTRVRRTKL